MHICICTCLLPFEHCHMCYHLSIVMYIALRGNDARDDHVCYNYVDITTAPADIMVVIIAAAAAAVVLLLLLIFLIICLLLLAVTVAVTVVVFLLLGGGFLVCIYIYIYIYIYIIHMYT